MAGEEPLMYSQFCYYIQQDRQKQHTTMNISHNPGEQIDVDWTGNPAHIINSATREITDAYLLSEP